MVAAKKVVRIFSLQEVLEGVETVKKGLEAEGEETDEVVHSKSWSPCNELRLLTRQSVQTVYKGTKFKLW